MDVELLYNSVKTEDRVAVTVGVRDGRDVVGKATSGRRGLGAPDEFQLEIGWSHRRDVVRKATPGRRGSEPPIELGSREDADKMQ